MATCQPSYINAMHYTTQNKHSLSNSAVFKVPNKKMTDNLILPCHVDIFMRAHMNALQTLFKIQFG